MGALKPTFSGNVDIDEAIKLTRIERARVIVRKSKTLKEELK